jgi:hypothetical protein
LAGDPRYAVRFANRNVWDRNTGMNNLGASVEVVSGGEGIEVQNEDPTSYTKIMRSGRIYILRGEKAYTSLGGEVATY